MSRPPSGQVTNGERAVQSLLTAVRLAVPRLIFPVALAAVLALSETAAAQTAEISYPPSRAVGDIAAWLRRDTPIPPSQVVDIGPSAVTAVVSATPTADPRGFRVVVNSEALSPAIESRDGIASWSIPAQVDCDRRAVRLGAMTGFPSRDLRTDPKVLRPADSAFVTPTPSAPLGAVIRALCDRDFHRPLVAGRLKTAAKDPQPAKPAKAVTSPVEPQPAARPKARTLPAASLSVQVGASSSLADAKRLLARLKKASAGLLSGLSTDVVAAQVGGKTVYRALISGFAAPADAARLCERLKASGQGCFVRR